jgi:hypothetical protein
MALSSLAGPASLLFLIVAVLLQHGRVQADNSLLADSIQALEAGLEAVYNSNSLDTEEEEAREVDEDRRLLIKEVEAELSRLYNLEELGEEEERQVGPGGLAFIRRLINLILNVVRDIRTEEDIQIIQGLLRQLINALGIRGKARKKAVQKVAKAAKKAKKKIGKGKGKKTKGKGKKDKGKKKKGKGKKGKGKKKKGKGKKKKGKGKKKKGKGKKKK